MASSSSHLGPSGLDLDIFFDCGELRYAAVGSVPFEPDGQENVAACARVTVLVAEDEIITISSVWLNKWLKEMEACDVYRQELFLDGLVITNVVPGQTVTENFYNTLERLGNKWVKFRYQNDPPIHLPPGPYLYFDKVLKPVFRLYDDTQRAFLAALTPKLDWQVSDTYSKLKAAGTAYDCLAVAVPARSPENLIGAPHRLRVAVKDCFCIKGMKTSLNNKCAYELNKPSASTAAVIESLVQDGAHILGLTKLSSMLAHEEPLDAVDFHTAFNPRGDGYQSPAGCSSGSAVAVASYDWLDCAIGSDTGDSGRRAAMVNGVWQFGPSQHLVDTLGMVITCLAFDTPCVFSRGLGALRRVMESWIPSSKPHMPVKHSYEIVVLDDYQPIQSFQQAVIMEAFIKDARVHLSATVRRFSLRDVWRANHPASTLANVDQYLENVIPEAYDYAYNRLNDNFYKEYAAQHSGQPPYTTPFVQRQSATGAAVTPAQHTAALDKLEVYRKWLCDLLFDSREKEALIILPVANAEPNYRDTMSLSAEDRSVLNEKFMSPILGAADIVVPIGDIPYNSRITGRIEFLPVVANVVGAPWTDMALLAAVEKIMRLSNRPTTVATGPRMFPGR